jgi:hypothetical protein
MDRKANFEKEETKLLTGAHTRIAKRRKEMILVIYLMLFLAITLIFSGTLCISRHCDSFGLCLADSPLKIPIQSCGLVDSKHIHFIIPFTI